MLIGSKRCRYILTWATFFLVHAGLDPSKAIAQQTQMDFCWIRDLFHAQLSAFFSHKRIITGHTITFTLPDVSPGKIATGPGWLDIDTGAYHPKSGWLTALDIDHGLVYQANTLTGAKRMATLEDASVEIDPAAVRPRKRRYVSPHQNLQPL